MKKLITFLLILLLPVLALADSSSSEVPGLAEASYNICGVVIDTTTGRTLGGVTISDGGSHSTVTGVNGLYTITVDSGWSGTLTPVLAGYTFSPANRTYDNVRDSFNNQNFDATPITFTISGNIADVHGNPLADVTLNYDGGSATTNASGNYSIVVPWNWSGSIVPFQAGVEFTPGSRSYSNVLASQVNQDFVSRFVPSFVITSSAGEGGGISPNGKNSVVEDGSLSFLINPADGYRISDVVVDGKSVGAVSSYTFRRVKQDHFIRAIFVNASMGWLKVVIVPGQAISEGAVWRIKGTTQWLPSSARLELPPGTYEIEFRDLPNWSSCCLEGAVVYSGKTTVVDDACYSKQDTGAKVRYFVADDYITSPVKGSTLRWYVEDSEDVTLSFEGVVKSVGDKRVNPASNSDYWLLANHTNGSVAAEVKLDVFDKPVIDWFTTDAGENSAVKAGESANLSWRVHGAENVTIYNVESGVEIPAAASASGAVETNPMKTTAYRLEAENSSGITEAFVTVHVTDKPVIKEFYALDSSLVVGQQTRIIWNVKGAASVKIEGIGKNLKSKGKKVISPVSDTKYLLVAENAAGVVEKEISVLTSENASDLSLQIEKILFDGMEVNKAYLGAELEAVITIVNNGTADAKAFAINICDKNGELARKENVSLAAGAVKTLKVKFIAMTDGEMGLKAIADPDAVLAEVNLADNEARRPFAGIVPPMPELVLSDIIFSLVDALDGKGVEISFQIKNVGKEKAENFQIDLDVNGRRVFWEAVDTIAKGETLSYKTTALIGNNKRFKVLFTIDRYQVVGELSRDNNIWYQKISTKSVR